MKMKGNAQEFINRKLVSEDKIVVLNGAGINLEHYMYTPISSRQENGKGEVFEDRKIHFLYLGRIMKEKGIDELFTAMRRLYEEYGHRVVLDIVGFFEDEYKNAVEKLVGRRHCSVPWIPGGDKTVLCDGGLRCAPFLS